VFIICASWIFCIYFLRFYICSSLRCNSNSSSSMVNYYCLFCHSTRSCFWFKICLICVIWRSFSVSRPSTVLRCSSWLTMECDGKDSNLVVICFWTRREFTLEGVGSVVNSPLLSSSCYCLARLGFLRCASSFEMLRCCSSNWAFRSPIETYSKLSLI